MNTMLENDSKADVKSIVKYAGAFIAWVIGSGFATGQEILQFFTGYGYWSYAIVLVNLVGFLLLGKIMLTKGYEHREDLSFNHYQYYCGKSLGKVYSWIIPFTLVLTMSVLISASGTTLHEYYGINKYMGSFIMAVLVLSAYLIGFDKMVRIVSLIGPVIILFTLFVGIFSVIRDSYQFREIGTHLELLSASQASPNWFLSSVLYLSLNFLCGSTYYTALGTSAKTRSDAKWGAIVGAILLILSISIMNTAILLNAGDTTALSVPTLYLAKRISYGFGLIFSIVLTLGMFSSCSTMMWSFCHRFFTEGSKRNTLFATGTAVLIFLLGLFSFQELVSIIYPLIGYTGLVFIACVLRKGSTSSTKLRGN